MGKISQHDIHQLSQYAKFRQFSPTSEVHDMLDDGDNEVQMLVRGVDRFHLTSRLSKSLLTAASDQPDINIDPFNLNEAFLISSFCNRNPKIMKTQRSDQRIRSICIKMNIY